MSRIMVFAISDAHHWKRTSKYKLFCISRWFRHPQVIIAFLYIVLGKTNAMSINNQCIFVNCDLQGTRCFLPTLTFKEKHDLLNINWPSWILSCFRFGSHFACAFVFRFYMVPPQTNAVNTLECHSNCILLLIFLTSETRRNAKNV